MWNIWKNLKKEAKRLGYDGVILVDEEEINC